jgi:hypothetical protein
VADIEFQSLIIVLSMENIGAVWTVDDIAMGSGPMIMPEIQFRHGQNMKPTKP